MKELFKQYWKEANQHKELDPLNFEIEYFTERFMYKHRNALRLFDVVGSEAELPEVLCRMNSNFKCNCIGNTRCPNFT